jgi:hypothetical protein
LPEVDVELYAVVFSKVPHAVMQAPMFWNAGVIPVSGASVEPQTLMSSVQKLVQASPHVPGAAALVLSPPGPAWIQWVAGVIIEGAPAW